MPLFPKVSGFLRSRASTSAAISRLRPSTAPSEAIDAEYITVNSACSQTASPVGALVAPPSLPDTSTTPEPSYFPTSRAPSAGQQTQSSSPSPLPSASTSQPAKPVHLALPYQRWWDDEPTRSATALAILQRWLESPEAMSTEPALLALAHPTHPSVNGYIALCEEIHRFNSQCFPPDFITLKLYLGLLDQTPTIPPLFWSHESSFLTCAANLSTMSGYTTMQIVSATHALRVELSNTRAYFVGHLSTRVGMPEDDAAMGRVMRRRELKDEVAFMGPRGEVVFFYPPPAVDQAQHPPLRTAPIQPSPPPSATGWAHSVAVPTCLPSTSTSIVGNPGRQHMPRPARPVRPSSPTKTRALPPQSPRRARRSTLTDDTSAEVEAMSRNISKGITPPSRGSIPPPLSPVAPNGPYPGPGSPQRPSSPIRTGSVSALPAPVPPRQRPPRARACTRGMSAPPTQSPAVDPSSLFDPNPHAFDRLGHFYDTRPEGRRTVDDIFAEAAARQSLSAALRHPAPVSSNTHVNSSELNQAVGPNAPGSSTVTTPTSSPHLTAAYTEPARPQAGLEMGLVPISRFAPLPIQLSTSVQAQERRVQRGWPELPFRALSTEPEVRRGRRNEGRLRFGP